MENEVKKSYNPFKMWGSWIGFIIGFSILLLGTIRPFGCSSQDASWDEGVYFGIESFNFVGSSNCTDYVTPKFKFCSEVSASPHYSYFAESHENIIERREDCLKNPNKYSFDIGGKFTGDPNIKITVDNIEREFSVSGGSQIFKIYGLLSYLYAISTWGLIPAFIFGSIGWGIHSLIRKYKK